MRPGGALAQKLASGGVEVQPWMRRAEALEPLDERAETTRACRL
jgi:hypothetical protein